MYDITSTRVGSAYSDQLQEWFIAEWGQVDPFSSNDIDHPLPCPIIATQDNKLLGGLSFTFAKIPNSTELGMWINAVLVAPEYRGLNIASKLVQSAEVEATRMGEQHLYVYSEFPELYEKLGWQVEVIDGDSKALKKVLAVG